MRPHILASLVSVVCVLAANAQTCVPAAHLGAVSVSGSTCTRDTPLRCEPGTTITFTPQFFSDSFTPATCPVQMTWDFGDGSPELTTTLTPAQPSVQHTFTAVRIVRVEGTAYLTNPEKLYREILIASGLFELPSRGPALEEGQSAQVSVGRTGDLSRSASVDYLTSGMLVPNAGTLTFGPGESQKQVTIQAADDFYWTPSVQTGEFVLRNPTGGWTFANPYSVGGDPRISLYIPVNDNDTIATHACTQTSLLVNEAAGVATFELTRTGNTNATTTGYVRVWCNWSLQCGKYSAAFAPGETSRFVNVPIVNDSVYAGTQTTPFTCGGEGPGTAAVQTSEGTLTVVDDEPFPSVVAPASIEVTETDAKQRLEIPVAFVPPFLFGPNAVLRLTHVTTSNADLSLVRPLISQGKIELDITGDDMPESDEIANVAIVGEINHVIQLTIRDDDRPAFPYTFDRDSYQFSETEAATVTVQRNGSVAAGAELTLTIVPSSGPEWMAPIPVVFEPGQSSVKVALNVDDALFTGQRTAILQLELSGFVGATASITVNDDERMPSLSIGDASVREGGFDQKTRLEVPLTLSAPVGYTLNIGITATHGTTNATDVNLAPRTATIVTGDVAGVAVFEINGDIDLENDETFTVTVTSCCNGLADVARRTATATILNDDGVPSETLYRFAAGATEFAESDKWLTVPVRRAGRTTGSTSATLRLTGDSRVAAPRKVTFAPNETLREERFYINDSAYSGDVDVRIELLDGDRVVDSYSVKIRDDEPPSVIFGGAHPVREGPNAMAVFHISIQPPSAQPVSMHLHDRSGDAYTNVDYARYDATIELPPFTSSYEFTIPVIDDRDAEGDEEFYLDVSNVTGARLVLPDYPYFRGYILDDDSIYLQYDDYALNKTTTSITLMLPTPAPADDAIFFYADPTWLAGPERIAVPKGARSVPIAVKTLRTGEAPFAVSLPSYLPVGRLKGTLNVFEPHSVTFTPAAVQLAPGESARIDLAFAPDATSFTARSADSNIAGMEMNTGSTSLTVYGRAPGATEITITFFASAGGGVVRLPVVVKDPAPPPTRSRGVRH
ncbi:MAG TPA: Calx-beta domain-containing protein [Thermoanaerobaculia bacterium]|nr:Calx-beta domain-containing protein [Thermoanaerobaculia bacterium]